MVDETHVIHEERHHAGVAVFRGPGHDRKAFGHLPVDDVFLGAARSVWTLRSQQLEIVAVEGAPFAALVFRGPVAFFDRCGTERAERARRFTRAGFPVETVLLAGFADDLLRVFTKAVAVPIRRNLLSLCVDDGKAGLLHRQLIAADPAVENLLLASARVETP